MAYEAAQVRLGQLVAAAAMTSNQYKFVKVTAADAFNLAAAATDRTIGVLQDTPASGQAGNICVVGVTKLIAGAAITAGASLGTDAAGLAVPLVAGTDTTKYAVGTALDAAAGSGSVFTAFVNCAAAGRAA